MRAKHALVLRLQVDVQLNRSCNIKLTFLSMGRSTLSLPKRTWNGEQASSTSPSVPDSAGRSTTMTSIAPVKVAGLMSL